MRCRNCSPPPPPVLRPSCSNVLFLVGGVAMELLSNAQWATGASDGLWYPQWYEMLIIQTVIAISAGTGMFLTAQKRTGAEQFIFGAYGLQALQGVLTTLWMSPYWPLRDCHAADIVLGATSIATCLYTLHRLPGHKAEALALRNKRNQRDAATTTPAPAAGARDLSQQQWYQDMMYWWVACAAWLGHGAAASLLCVHGTPAACRSWIGGRFGAPIISAGQGCTWSAPPRQPASAHLPLPRMPSPWPRG